MSNDLGGFLKKFYTQNASVAPIAATAGPSSAATDWRQKKQGSISAGQFSKALKHKCDVFLGKGVHGDLFLAGGAEKRQRLAAGINSDYGDDASGGDLAFAVQLFREKFSLDEIESVMRAYRYRDKFDTYRGEHRYLEMTINKAAQVGGVVAGGGMQIAQAVAGPSERPPRLALSDGLIEFSDLPPSPRDYVTLGMLAEKLCILAGFGGTGKSQLGIQMGIDVATGGAVFGIPVTPGAVLIVMGEEDKPEIARRINATVKELGLANMRTRLVERIRAFALVGVDIRLTAKQDRQLAETAFVNEIIEAAKALALASGVPLRLIILDHFGLLHGGGFNEREDAAVTMVSLNRIAKETGAAVLVLAHSPKSAAVSETSDASAVAGSTAFVDQARGAFVLAGMREAEAKFYGIDKEARGGYVSCVMVKNNYGPSGIDTTKWFERCTVQGYGVSVLKPTQLHQPVRVMKGSASVEQRIIDFIVLHRGEFSNTKLRDVYSGANGPLKSSKREVAIALDALVGDGRLVLREPTSDERVRGGVARQAKLVLDVPCG